MLCPDGIKHSALTPWQSLWTHPLSLEGLSVEEIKAWLRREAITLGPWPRFARSDRPAERLFGTVGTVPP